VFRVRASFSLVVDREKKSNPDRLTSVSTPAIMSVDEEYVQMILEADWDSTGIAKHSWGEEFLLKALAIFHGREGFTVTLDEVADLLKRRVDNVQARVFQRLQEGVDYIVQQQLSTGGRPKKQVLLSPWGAKNLAILVEGERALALRSYFLLVEDVFHEEKVDAIRFRRTRESDEETMSKTKRQPVPPEIKVGHCVYVVRVTDESGRLKHKVGRSKNLKKRWSGLRHTILGRLELAHQRMVDEDVFLETCAHKLLRNVRLDHEVEMFESDINKILKALDICERHSKQMDEEFAADG